MGRGSRLQSGKSKAATSFNRHDDYSEITEASELSMQNEIVFNFPVEYNWLVERGIVGFAPFTQLQPWYFTPKDQSFWVTSRWQNNACRDDLFVFARRQDNDELACLAFNKEGNLSRILVIQGWVGDGFEILKEFPSFWEWFKYVIDDIADWISSE